jgi:bacillithiol synthase
MNRTETHGVCIRHTDLPGTSRLFRDFLYHFDDVAPYFQHDPSSPDSLAHARKAIQYPDSRRAQVAEALREINPPSANLDLFAQPNTAAVLTGQQVGLYGGPAYTLYKALSAIVLAGQLTKQGHPTVPIFWLATEDHDVEEIRAAHLWDQSITAQAASDGRPAGLHTLQGLPETKLFNATVQALADRHYTNGQTFGQAFLGLLQELLSPLGLIFADPLHPTLRAAGAAFLSQAAEAAPHLSQALVERGHSLEANGYHAQVHFDPKQTSLLFKFEGEQRQQLKFDGQQYSSGKQSWTPAELAQQGAALSPNALLRPVWQDWLFPTVALYGGPGELAYFAQSEVLYRELLGRMPVVLPRSFFTIVDPKSESILERYRLRYQEVLQNEEQVRDAISRRLIPPPLLDTLNESEQRIERAFHDLDIHLSAFDPTLVAASANSQSKVRYQFLKNKAKIIREVLRKNDQAQRQAAHLSHRLAPHGHLQERHYCLLSMLDEYGLDFIPTILENIHTDCHDHHVLMLG